MAFEHDFVLCYLQVPSKSLLLAVWAAGIGGTFQCGYNTSIINAPTKVRTVCINEFTSTGTCISHMEFSTACMCVMYELLLQ